MAPYPAGTTNAGSVGGEGTRPLKHTHIKCKNRFPTRLSMGQVERIYAVGKKATKKETQKEKRGLAVHAGGGESTKLGGTRGNPAGQADAAPGFERFTFAIGSRA